MKDYYVGECECRWTRDGPFTRFCPIHSGKVSFEESLQEQITELKKRIEKLERPPCSCDKCREKR